MHFFHAQHPIRTDHRHRKCRGHSAPESIRSQMPGLRLAEHDHAAPAIAMREPRAPVLFANRRQIRQSDVDQFEPLLFQNRFERNQNLGPIQVRSAA